MWNRWLVGLLIATTLPELVLLGADFGLWGSNLWRDVTYAYGAFWNGLLDDWRPNFALQPYIMFLTYAFLHAGLAHLVLNMLTLATLGRLMLERTGQLGFLLVYFAAVVGGGFGFALLSQTDQPMVGASGGLFGLAGYIVMWNISTALPRVQPQDRWRAVRRYLLTPIAVLIAIHPVLYLLTGYPIAWETHLGGFLTGAALAFVIPRRSWR